jgi:hypothetical protein
VTRRRKAERDHFYLQERFIAVIEEVFGFAAVNSHYAQEELTAETQSHCFNFLTHYGL